MGYRPHIETVMSASTVGQEARRLLENPMLLLKFFFPLYYCACIHQIIRMEGRMGGWRGIDSAGKVFPGLGIIGHNRQFPP
jgi:hypothetical protein